MSTVVVVHADSRCAAKLAAGLDGHFRQVAVAASVAELKNTIAKHRADIAIVDLDAVTFVEVAELCRELAIDVICTHRCADEEMWSQALNAGAIDCLYTDDVRSIVAAATRKALTAAVAA